MVAEQDAAEPKKTSKLTYVTWGIVIAAILILFVIPYGLTASPKSCTRCHEMDKYYDSWQKSVHAKAANNCFFCHVKPGLVSVSIYRIAFYREIFAAMSGSSLKPSGATIPATNNCNRSGCHSLNRISSVSGDIKVDHRNHIKKAKLTCAKCHPGVSHPNGGVTPPREMCKTCHAQRINDCAMCHLKKFQRGEKFEH